MDSSSIFLEYHLAKFMTAGSTEKKKGGGYLARKAKKAVEGDKSSEQADYEKKLKNKDSVTVEDVLKLSKITEGKKSKNEMCVCVSSSLRF